MYILTSSTDAGSALTRPVVQRRTIYHVSQCQLPSLETLIPVSGLASTYHGIYAYKVLQLPYCMYVSATTKLITSALSISVLATA